MSTDEPERRGDQAAPPPRRVLVVDDHALIRAGVRAALTDHPDLSVCGEAADGAEGAELALRLRPDVVLMDVAMPRLSGIEATARIVRDWAQARVVLLTAFADVALVRIAVRAGAWGYVLKDADPATIVGAVRTTLAGGRPVTPSVGDLLSFR